MRHLAAVSLVLVGLAACAQPPMPTTTISQADSKIVFQGQKLGLTRVSGTIGETADFVESVDREVWRNNAKKGNFASLTLRSAPIDGVYDDDVTSMVKDYIPQRFRGNASFGSTGTAQTAFGLIPTVPFTYTGKNKNPKSQRYCIGFKYGLGYADGDDRGDDLWPANIFIGVFCDSAPLQQSAISTFFGSIGVKGFGVPN